jgi:threonine/homoserine efflux transporter RhtA
VIGAIVLDQHPTAAEVLAVSLVVVATGLHREESR